MRRCRQYSSANSTLTPVLRTPSPLSLRLPLSSDGDHNLQYKATVACLQGSMPPTKFHIHQGNASTKGPLLINLAGAWKATSSGAYDASGVAKRLSKLKTDDGKSTWQAVFAAIGKKPGEYYVNIHTAKYPDGAVRGQFCKA